MMYFSFYILDVTRILSYSNVNLRAISDNNIIIKPSWPEAQMKVLR